VCSGAQPESSQRRREAQEAAGHPSKEVRWTHHSQHLVRPLADTWMHGELCEMHRGESGLARRRRPCRPAPTPHASHRAATAGRHHPTPRCCTQRPLCPPVAHPSAHRPRAATPPPSPTDRQRTSTESIRMMNCVNRSDRMVHWARKSFSSPTAPDLAAARSGATSASRAVRSSARARSVASAVSAAADVAIAAGRKRAQRKGGGRRTRKEGEEGAGSGGAKDGSVWEQRPGPRGCVGQSRGGRDAPAKPAGGRDAPPVTMQTLI